MASTQISSSLYACSRHAWVSKPSRTSSNPRVASSNLGRVKSAFTAGSSLSMRTNSNQWRYARKVAPIAIRCEQGTQQSNSLDVWLGRFAMVGFASAITVEIVTGKGLLENFGLTSPLPTVALGVTALVGVLTAVFIFQSASRS